MEKVIIFGNGVFAEHIYFLLTHDSPYQVAAFTVDADYIHEDKLFGLPVVPFETVENAFPPDRHGMSVAVSFQRVNRLREEKYLQAKEKGYRLINYIHSKTSQLPGLITGDNCLVLENCVLGAHVEIGNNVVVGSSAVIGHHTILQDHCFIAPGAVILGRVLVGDHTLIGANATIKEEVRIAPECLIGSGVSITRNTREKGVYVQPPVELFPKRSDELRTWLTWPLRAAGSSPVV